MLSRSIHMILISQAIPNTAQPVQSNLCLLRFSSDRTMFACPQRRLKLMEVSQFCPIRSPGSQHLVCYVRLITRQNIVLAFRNENRHRQILHCLVSPLDIAELRPPVVRTVCVEGPEALIDQPTELARLRAVCSDGVEDIVESTD